MTRLPHPLPVVVAGCLLAGTAACSSPAAEGGGNNEPATGANQTFRFGVGTGGKVSAPSMLQATRGSDVKLVLRNGATTPYVLEVEGPRQRTQLVVKAPAGRRGQGNVVLGKTGTYQVTVGQARSGTNAQSFSLTVGG